MSRRLATRKLVAGEEATVPRAPLVAVILLFLGLSSVLAVASCASPYLEAEPTPLSPTEPSTPLPEETNTLEPAPSSPAEPSVAPPMQALTLDNYPNLFEKEVMIVVGGDATQLEKDVSRVLAETLLNLTGDNPTIKVEEQISEDDKADHNLVVIGTPRSTATLHQVYELTDATRVSQGGPEGKAGVLEIVANPWNPRRFLLLISGSDEWEVAALLEVLDKYEELDTHVATSRFQMPTESAFLDDYVFFELHRNTHVEVTEGSYQGPIIDSPTYSFDEESGALRDYVSSLSVDDSLMIVYGANSSVSGSGGGRENLLYGVHQLPYSLGNLTILNIDVNGSLYLRYNEKLVVLADGKMWESTDHVVDTTSSGTAELTKTERLRNYGFLPKSAIRQ